MIDETIDARRPARREFITAETPEKLLTSFDDHTRAKDASRGMQGGRQVHRQSITTLATASERRCYQRPIRRGLAVLSLLYKMARISKMCKKPADLVIGARPNYTIPRLSRLPALRSTDDPPAPIKVLPQTIMFTGNPHSGRFGLFPPLE